MATELKGVTGYRDRHGKTRYRFRLKGFVPHHFVNTDPNSAAFLAELATAKERKPEPIGAARITPGTVSDLLARYYGSVRWQGLEPQTQANFRRVLEKFRDKHGDKPVAMLTTAHLDRIFGKLRETPGAANNLRKRLKAVFAFAVKIGMLRENPAEHTDGFPSGPGFHCWTDEEIEQYRAHHPYGTKARLAMELLLNTAARKSNIVKLRRADYRGGKFHVQHIKGGDATVVAALDETVKAIEAMAVPGIGTFLVTEFGKPFTANGFGNWFRERCDEAGLPQCSAHGLRKAMARQLAESHASDAMGRAVTGQKKNETFAYYAAKANREGLADAAMANLATRKMANPVND